MPKKPFKYDVFISYSRDDIKFAKNLQSKLERTFRKVDKNNRKSKKRLRVIRDETDFNQNPDLWSEITGILSSCEKLIVVCSVSAKKSDWVNKEIEAFKEIHEINKTERIIPILIQGDENISFPKNLIANKAYTLAIEFREKEIDNYNKYFKKEGLFKVYAAVLDIDYNVILDRHRDYERRILTKIVVLSIIVSIIFITLSLFALTQKRLAIKNAKYATEQRSKAEKNEKIAIKQKKIAEENTRVAIEQRKIAENNAKTALIKEVQAVANQSIIANRNYYLEIINNKVQENDKLLALWVEHSKVLIDFVMPNIKYIHSRDTLAEIARHLLRGTTSFGRMDKRHEIFKTIDMKKGDLFQVIEELSKSYSSYTNEINEVYNINVSNIENQLSEINVNQNAIPKDSLLPNLELILTNCRDSMLINTSKDLIVRAGKYIDSADYFYLNALYYYMIGDFSNSEINLNNAFEKKTNIQKYHLFEFKVKSNVLPNQKLANYTNVAYEEYCSLNTNITKEKCELCILYYIRMKEINSAIGNIEKEEYFIGKILYLFRNYSGYLSQDNYSIYLKSLVNLIIIEERKENYNATIELMEEYTQVSSLLADLAYISRKEVASAYYFLTKHYIRSEKYEDAIQAAKDGIFLDTENNMKIKMSLAHAYMFNGEIQKCLKIHSKNKGKLVDGVNWMATLREDFTKFKNTKKKSEPIDTVAAYLKLTY